MGEIGSDSTCPGTRLGHVFARKQCRKVLGVDDAGCHGVVREHETARSEFPTDSLEGLDVPLFLVVDEHHVEGTVVALDDIDSVAVFELGAVSDAAALEVLPGGVEFVLVDFGQHDVAVSGKRPGEPVRGIAKPGAELEDTLGVSGAGKQREPAADIGADRREPLTVGAVVHLPEYLVAFGADCPGDACHGVSDYLIRHTAVFGERGDSFLLASSVNLNSMQTRRTVLKTLGVATAGLSVGGSAGARLGRSGVSQVQGVRIGCLQPLAGLVGRAGKRALEPFYSYFGYRGADVPAEIRAEEIQFVVDDTTYVIDVRDTAAGGEDARSLAEEVAADASVLVGGSTTETARAAAEVAAETGTPYLAGPVGDPTLTGQSDTCARPVFRAGTTDAMAGVTGARYLAEERDDVGSVYLFYGTSSYGGAIRRGYESALESSGITVAGSSSVGPQSNSWSEQLQQAADAGVDAVVGGFGANTLPTMVQSYLQADYSFRLVAPWGGEEMAARVGSVLEGELETLSATAIEEAGIGPFTTRYHWNQYDNDINDSALSVYREAYNRNPGPGAAGMFATASALVQAIEQAGSLDGEALIAELRRMTIEETLKGQDAYEFRAVDNQATSPMTAAPVVPTTDDQYWDAAIQPGEPATRIGRDQTAPPASSATCDLSSDDTTDDSDSTGDQTERPDGNGSETTEPGSGGNDGTTSDDRETTTSESGSGEDGPLGLLVGIAGIAGGLGAAWVHDRTDDEE